MRPILPRALLSSLIALAACGDDGDGGPDAATHNCNVPESPALPSTGEITRASELPLPATCVPGGLRDLPGRWFVANPSAIFTFGYPRYAGSCAEGFRNEFGRAIDLDDSDGTLFHVWSDGTTYFERRYIRYEFEDGTIYEVVRGYAACMTPDGNLASAYGSWDPDRGFLASTGVGTRFGLKDGPAEGLERLGSLAVAPDHAIIGYNVVVDGNHAYVCGPEGLDIIDVTDPAAPVHRGHIGGASAGLDGINDVRVVHGAGRTIAFGSALGGEATYVIDVTDPANPMYLADIPEYSHSVQVRSDGKRTFLYLATYTASVPVYDITDPTTPVRLGAPTVADGDDAGIHDLTVSADGNMIYANNTIDGVVAIDVSGGLDQTPVERWRIDTSYSHASWSMTTASGRRILLHGDEGMSPGDGGAFLRIIDDDPESATYGELIGRYQSRPEVGIHNIQAVGDKVYLSYYQDGIRILDVADPTQPREIAHYNTWDEATAPGGAFEGAVGVRKVGDYVYVADIAQGLIILRELPAP